MKILHIDDIDEISRVYSEILSTHGHQFDSVTEGTKGFDMAVRDEYDLILLDMSMPGYSGFDFLADLSQIKPSVLKKIIVLTALDLDPEAIQEILDYGIISIEEKPVSIQSIVSIMSQKLENSLPK